MSNQEYHFASQIYKLKYVQECMTVFVVNEITISENKTKRLDYTRFELCIKLKMGIHVLRKYLININLFINLMENRSHFQRIYNTAAKVNV